ncbi:hypothetical protein CCYA_CCYA06G1819 [Cyanidiococcus yangmingshanensis]|nr:hypothetical protein CCYA_CCYA06G1819 [Cyanidiococcus yangmingshanensis]
MVANQLPGATAGQTLSCCGPEEFPSGRAHLEEDAEPLPAAVAACQCGRSTFVPIVVAYTCNTKKQKPFFDVLEHVASEDATRLRDDSCGATTALSAERCCRPIRLVEIDLGEDADASKRGRRSSIASLSRRPKHWDLILHKRTDDMVMARRNDKNAQQRMAIFQRDLAIVREQERLGRRRVPIIDPLEAVSCLTDRVQFSSTLDALLASGKLDAGPGQEAMGGPPAPASVVRLTKWCAGPADCGAQVFSLACRETIAAYQRNTISVGDGAYIRPDGLCRNGSAFAELDCCRQTWNADARRGTIGDILRENLVDTETSLGTLELGQPIPWVLACELAGMRYPLVVKRRTACGPRSSHDLALVYDMEGLEALLSDPSTFDQSRDGTRTSPFAHDDIYIQEYIPHGHAVFKIYVIGSESQVSMHARSTLPIPREADRGYRLLNTYDFGKDAISDQPTDASDRAGALWYPQPPSRDDACRLARFVIKYLRVTLFGLDVLRSAVDDALYIVDLNYFPSFKDVPDAHVQLLNYLRQCHLDASRRPPHN